MESYRFCSCAEGRNSWVIGTRLVKGMYSVTCLRNARVQTGAIRCLSCTLRDNSSVLLTN